MIEPDTVLTDTFFSLEVWKQLYCLMKTIL